MIGFSLVAIVGLVMLLASQNPHVKYTGCFFFAMGIYPNVPQGVAWNGNNIGGSVKRGVGIAMHVGFGKFETSHPGSRFSTDKSVQAISEVPLQVSST